jgi:lysophospholipase L1-like esterase
LLWLAFAPAAARCLDLEDIRAKLRGGVPLTLASIGDSITWICFHTDARRNYLTFVAEALRKCYPAAIIRLEQSGNRGSTPRAMPFLDKLLETRPDMVFIMFGMSDCRRGLAQLDNYGQNLTALIRRVRQAGAVPVVLTQNEIVYPADGRENLPQYVARAKDAALRERVPLVDHFSDWHELQRQEPDTWKLYLNDEMHPDLAGHRRFAQAILRQLWPEAAGFQSSGLWPLAGKLGPAAECLVPGPAGKQLLRVNASTWVALTGRRRGAEVTDLVLSIARAARPTWGDFRHVTLVGPDRDAVFPWGERDINSGLLLHSDHRLYIFFSHTVRRSLLTVDTGRTGWEDGLQNRNTYEAFDGSAVPLPQSIGGSYQEDTEFVDGYLDATGPVLLYRDLLLNVGQGILRSSLWNGGSTLVFRNFTRAAAASAGNGWCALGQPASGAPLAIACSSGMDPLSPPLAPRQFTFGVFGGALFLFGRPERAGWSALRWDGARWEEMPLSAHAREATAIAPIVWRDAALLLTGESGGVHRYLLRGGAWEPRGEPWQAVAGESWRYEMNPPAGSSEAGLLGESDHGLTFSAVQLPATP